GARRRRRACANTFTDNASGMMTVATKNSLYFISLSRGRGLKPPTTLPAQAVVAGFRPCSGLSSRTLPIISIFEQLPDSGILDGSWIVIRIFGGNPCCAVQTVRRHADIFKRERRAQPRCQVIDSLRRVLDAERFCSDVHCIRCSLAIEFHRMGQ